MRMLHTSVHHKTANLLPAWAVKMPQGECFLLACKWQSGVFRQRSRHEVTALQLFSSVLAHNGRSHYIMETQVRVCFRHGKDAQEKQIDATCCLINPPGLIMSHFFHRAFSLKSATVKRTRNVFQCNDDQHIMHLLCLSRWSSLWASWSTRLWIMGSRRTRSGSWAPLWRSSSL